VVHSPQDDSGRRSSPLYDATSAPTEWEHVSPLPVGLKGEVCVTGPGVAPGYLLDGDETCGEVEDIRLDQSRARPRRFFRARLPKSSCNKCVLSADNILDEGSYFSSEPVWCFRTGDLGIISPDGKSSVTHMLESPADGILRCDDLDRMYRIVTAPLGPTHRLTPQSIQRVCCF